MINDDLFLSSNSDLEIKRLRKEQNRLNKEVEELAKIVNAQSKRIDRLSRLLSDGSGK